MKNFTNCTPDEFAVQSVKLRVPLLAWLKAVGAADIRKKYAAAIPDDASDEERLRATLAFLGEVQNAALEKCPDLTREVLCIATFTDPDDYANHPFPEYVDAAYEMYMNKAVRDFFTRSLYPSLTTFSTR